MKPSRVEMDSGLYRYSFGTAQFDQARFELRVGGALVEVQRKPLEVLLELLIQAGQVVTKEQLLKTVWQGRPTVDNVVGNAVKKLRAALGEQNAGRIETEHGVGYRFAGQLEHMVVGRAHVNRMRFDPGAVIPTRTDFVLVRLLGNSHRSDVWLARHSQTRAERVYKFSADAAGLDALKREVTASRLLNSHRPQQQCFVRIIDWNFASAPFYLESEYGGQNLPEWAEDGSRLASLSQTQRLSVFLRIADAVGAAHAVGVLHTDLKPTNVLIKEADSLDRGPDAWEIRLTDFGSSRLLDAQGLKDLDFTPLGFTINTLNETSDGTPLYMAPELVEGQTPTVRSDVYALGLMLYQLLTGNFQHGLTSGWERNIEDEFVRQDILRATDVETERRFASVQEFTNSLRTVDRRREEQQRILIAVHAAQVAQQELQRARARKPWVIATLCVLLSALTVVGWFAVRLNIANQAASKEAMRAEAVAGFLQDMLRNANPASGKGYDVTLAAALQETASELKVRFADAPLTEAAVRRTAADLYVSVNNHRSAIVHLERAIDLLRAQLGGNAVPTLQARYLLGKILAQAADFTRAEKVLKNTDRDTAAARQESNLTVALPAATAWARYHLARLQMTEAESRLEAAQRHQLALDANDAKSLLAIRVDLAQVYNHSGRWDAAIALLRGLDSSLYSQSSVGKPLRAKAASVYGSALGYAGQFPQAQLQLESALQALQVLYGPDSFHAAEQHAALAVMFGNQDRFAEALLHTIAARKIFCTARSAHSPACLQQSANEGIMQIRSGDFPAAVGNLMRAYDGFQQLSAAKNSPALQIISYYLACAQLELGKVHDAAAFATGLQPEALSAASPGDLWDMRVQALRGSLLIAQHRPTQGLALLQPAVESLDADKMQEWMVAPWRKRLAAAQHH